MPDISMCFGKYCPRKDKCYRAMAKPDRVQTYGDFETDCELQDMCEKPTPLGVGWIAQIMCM